MCPKIRLDGWKNFRWGTKQGLIKSFYVFFECINCPTFLAARGKGTWSPLPLIPRQHPAELSMERSDGSMGIGSAPSCRSARARARAGKKKADRDRRHRQQLSACACAFRRERKARPSDRDQKKPSDPSESDRRVGVALPPFLLGGKRKTNCICNSACMPSIGFLLVNPQWTHGHGPPNTHLRCALGLSC